MYSGFNSYPTNFLPDFSAASAVVPIPMNGSSIVSFSYVYISIHLLGSSIGKGAGCPALLADAAGNFQILLVRSKKSSLLIVDFRPSILGRSNMPFENTNIYSWMSRRVGLVADNQLPQAVDEPELEPLSHMICPLISNPSEIMS